MESGLVDTQSLASKDFTTAAQNTGMKEQKRPYLRASIGREGRVIRGGWRKMEAEWKEKGLTAI